MSLQQRASSQAQEYAERKRQALERAKMMREQRKLGISDEPPSSNGGSRSAPQDSLDDLMSHYPQKNEPSNAFDDMPVKAPATRTAPKQETDDADSLAQYMASRGGRNASAGQNGAQYASQSNQPPSGRQPQRSNGPQSNGGSYTTETQASGRPRAQRNSQASSDINYAAVATDYRSSSVDYEDVDDAGDYGIRQQSAPGLSGPGRRLQELQQQVRRQSSSQSRQRPRTLSGALPWDTQPSQGGPTSHSTAPPAHYSRLEALLFMPHQLGSQSGGASDFAQPAASSDRSDPRSTSRLAGYPNPVPMSQTSTTAGGPVTGRRPQARPVHDEYEDDGDDAFGSTQAQSRQPVAQAPVRKTLVSQPKVPVPAKHEEPVVSSARRVHDAPAPTQGTQRPTLSASGSSSRLTSTGPGPAGTQQRGPSSTMSVHQRVPSSDAPSNRAAASQVPSRASSARPYAEEEEEESYASVPPARSSNVRSGGVSSGPAAGGPPKRPAPAQPQQAATRRPVVREEPQYDEDDEQDHRGSYSSNSYGTSAAARPTSGMTKPYSAAPANFGSPGGMDEEEPSGDIDMSECPDCGRSFATDRLEKHMKICKKVFGTKRKAFDVTAMRVEGTDAAQFVKKQKRSEANAAKAGAGGGTGAGAGNGAKQGNGEIKKMAKWKVQRAQFLNMIRAAKGPANGEGGGYTAEELAEMEVMDDRVECPHCSRKFNPSSADKHIAICANLSKKPSTLKRGQGNAGGTRALETRSAAPPTKMERTQALPVSSSTAAVKKPVAATPTSNARRR